MKNALPIVITLLASPGFAEIAREMDAHEHGVGALNIAVQGDTVAMELHAPGSDIVGFEYEAETASDRAAIDAAVAVLAKPLELFALPAAAECSVIKASAGLENEEDHDQHDDHGHDEHAEGEEHDDDHDAHSEAEASHTEFHAEYTLTCANTDAMTDIDFAYFDTFENAIELEVQIVTASGAQAFSVMRDSPTLELRGMF